MKSCQCQPLISCSCEEPGFCVLLGDYDFISFATRENWDFTKTKFDYSKKSTKRGTIGYRPIEVAIILHLHAFSKGGDSYKKVEKGKGSTKIIKSVLLSFAQVHICSSSKDSYQKHAPLSFISLPLLVMHDKKYVYMCNAVGQHFYIN